MNSRAGEAPSSRTVVTGWSKRSPATGASEMIGTDHGFVSCEREIAFVNGCVSEASRHGCRHDSGPMEDAA